VVTVEASERNWRRLQRAKDPGESMDDVLTEALDALESQAETKTPE
jgi:hypothetical protein